MLCSRYQVFVLGKVKGNIDFESFMEFHNAPLSDSTELFLWGCLGKGSKEIELCPVCRGNPESSLIG